MRRRSYTAAVGLALALAGAAPAQQPPAEKEREEKPSVQIGTTLVQVDAIVTDKSGRPVTDLTRDDFQVLQDDQQQDITTFVYVPTHPAPPPPAAEGPTPPVRVAPERVRRTIAIVIDDLKSSESARVTREAVRRFVDERMEPGDLVAIVQARAGAGALQQFSGDRQELHAAIDRIRYVPRSHNEADCEEGAGSTSSGERDLSEALRTDIFVRGTLGVLNFVVRGLKELPGRKSVILLSDGMSCALEDTDPRATGSNRVRTAILNLVDLANRGSVAIYSVDVRGVASLAVPASDGQLRPRLSDLADLVGKERSKLFHSRDVMSFLASQTGGLFFFNNNDIAEGIRRAADDQGGYYLLAYEPDPETFAPKDGGRDFHKLTVRVRREGLTVRSRTGFYGYSDEQKMPETRSRAQQMVDAVISPFAASDVRMQLTPLFADDPKAGPVVRCLLYVDARDLTFVEERDGWRKAVVDVALVAFGDNGGMVSRQADTHEIRIRGDAYDLALKRGLLQIVTLPLKRPGAYQLRAAVRDAASERIGSAYQFVELPDVADGEFALSGIVVSSDAAPVDQRALDRRQAAPELPVSPAVRRFRRGDRVAYAFEVYNAARDRATKRTALEVSTRIYREGRLVHASDPVPLDPGAQTDWSRIRIGRGLLLGTEMEPGSYVLEVFVTDLANKRRTASQWVDFEIEGS
jgi:VWFA-related protein